jgi:hypothetical protein
MSEDTEAPIKRGPGRPRKEPPAYTRHKMKAKPNWDEDDIGGLEDESPDRLAIDPAIVPEGMSLQWVTDSIYGQQVPQHRARFEKRGWTPVHQEDFDGAFDGLFMPRGAEGEIKVDGMVLMARPEEMTRRARQEDKRKANEVIRIKEAALRGGDINTSLDSQHPSALNTNRINRTMERLQIPEDRE